MYKIGDRVKWTSQSKGYRKTKEGVVVEVVEPTHRPNRWLFPDLYKHPMCGFGRKKKSYVILVKKTHYWPVASKLERA